MTFPARHISVSINHPSSEVYEFTSNPENLPKWAEGLSGGSVIKSGDFWVSESPMGKVKIKFAEKNNLGVLDHDVTLPSGETNHNPFRVLKNGDGSEVVFTLYRLPKVTDQDFEKDAKQVEKDLKKLKSLLEK
ncbi:SRPBCC family protein [Bdellovibrio bacteriovorus]|uniref:SRPBCC family protein n=1 Tax=Bdellovibrio TaxID=958 RepID=UPI0035A95C94